MKAVNPPMPVGHIPDTRDLELDTACVPTAPKIWAGALHRLCVRGLGVLGQGFCGEGWGGRGAGGATWCRLGRDLAAKECSASTHPALLPSVQEAPGQPLTRLMSRSQRLGTGRQDGWLWGPDGGQASQV